MSDNYITITTLKEIEDPVKTKDEVIQWMQSMEFIEKDLTGCVMDFLAEGYKPGKNHVIAIGYDEDILSLHVCGVECKTGRNVFNAGAFTAMAKVICPECGKNRFEGLTPQDFFDDNCTEEQLILFHDVFPEFHNWTKYEEATLTCPYCSTALDVENYRISKGLSLSNFGMTFWNWPDLTSNFLDVLQTIIGTEITRINGHL